MFLLPQMRSLHQPKQMITSTATIIMIITKTTAIITTTITVKTRAMTTITKIKRIALMKRQSIAKSYEHNCKKFERKNTNFLNLKTYEEQADQIDRPQTNKSNECVIFFPN